MASDFDFQFIKEGIFSEENEGVQQHLAEVWSHSEGHAHTYNQSICCICSLIFP